MDKLVLDPNDLGDLDPACLQEALDAANLIDPVTLKLKGSIPKGEAKINKDCFVDTNDDDILDTPLDGTGTCSPVPDCALDSATTVATELAEATYNALAAATSECGNVILETGEQCDDGDTDPGDGCNATCELEGQSCGTPIGPRTVTIAINTPQTLAGVRVDLDYPQFQAGIQGTGQSSIVQSQVSILQGIPGDFISIANDRETDLTVVIGSAGAFINTGDLIEVAMDACVALAQNLCNRNQNIIGCCQNPGECADPNLPPSCTSFPLTEVGAGTPAGCCPADNACVSQTTATTCSVSGAVDENGVEIPGVTCTITITGT
jgi:cysteine-rich repeat protein